MPDFQQMEVEYIHRTVDVLDQYNEIIRPLLPEAKSFEVTLLLNCLSGLLVYSYEKLSYSIERFEIPKPEFYSTKIAVSQDEWFIEKNSIRDAGRTRKELGNPSRKLSVEELDIDNFVRQIRNSMSHARYEQQKTLSGNIDVMVFTDRSGFHAELSINVLEKFIRKFAEEMEEVFKQYVFNG